MCKHVPKISLLKGKFGDAIPKSIYENGTAVCKKCGAEIICDKKPEKRTDNFIVCFFIITAVDAFFRIIGRVVKMLATSFYAEFRHSLLLERQIIFSIGQITVDVKLLMIKIVLLAIFFIPAYYFAYLLCTYISSLYIRCRNWTEISKEENFDNSD